MSKKVKGIIHPDKISYETQLYDTFTDFAGEEHNFCIVGVIYKASDIHAGIAYYPSNVKEHFYTTGYTNASKVLSIGIAICNPIDADKFKAGIGHAMAKGRALKSLDRAIVVTKSGLMDTSLADMYVQRTADALKNNPGLFIAGYNSAECKFTVENMTKQ